MSSPQNTVRHRGPKDSSKKRGTTPEPSSLNGAASSAAHTIKQNVPTPAANENGFRISLVLLTLAGFLTRYSGLAHPDQVVFDEVHFGKFASLYLRRSYFFDVHPPFGKLLFAFAGWLAGYDGDFLFENIGDSYTNNRVPYVAYRSMPALLGTFTVSVVFMIMWESGYSLPASILAAALVCFDNAHIGQTRLILLDATLVFFMALSILCYIRFYKLRHAPFSRKWWKWLLLTGISMSCVISTKYVGAFTFFSIGVPVIIDLWDLLDVNRRQGVLSLPVFLQHFAARAIGLIIVPFLMYLFWFQVHFSILSRSGPGDDFMTPEFQETLSDNLMTLSAVRIEYFDNINLRHKETKVYLHSHPDRYPLRYDDGRISSQGQQVTGYPHNDTNNQWQIIPSSGAVTTRGVPVRAGDVVQLRHVVTNTFLLTHDVASPYFPTNQEFTTITPEESTERYNDTLFEIRVDHAKTGQEFKTMSSHFKLVHYPSRVAMWTHTTPLPDWAFKQAEINGNKNVQQSTNTWYVEDISGLPEGSPRLLKEPRKPKHMPFLKKYFELQRAMFHHNNMLTSDHPYASVPIQWPFLLRGVSFWTDAETREQIYFLGNPLSWWFASAILAVFGGVLFADQLSVRRGVDALDKRTRARLYNSTGFFFLVWAAHYVPFFTMGRQLFLHHYLPAHLASALVAGAVVEFVFNIESNELSSLASGGSIADGKKVDGANQVQRTLPIRERIEGQNLRATWIASSVITTIVFLVYWFFAPLTYGSPGMTAEEVVARKWLNYDFHFAK